MKLQFPQWFFKVAFVINVGLSISYAGLWISAVMQDSIWRSDFTMLYTGGALVRDHHGANLYDYELQTRYQQNIIGELRSASGVLPFNYPPYVAFLFIPLTYFPLSIAYALWSAIQIVLLIISAWQLRRFAKTEGWNLKSQRLLFLSIIALPALLLSLALGTLTLFSTLSLLLFYLALRADKEYQAGLWLVVGSVKPQIVLLHGLVLLATKRWRVMGLVLVVALSIGVLVTLILGGNVWVEFLKMVSFSGQQFGTYGIHPTGMYNLKGTLTVWLGKANATTINRLSWLSFGFSGLLTYWIWRQQHLTKDVALFDLSASLTTLWGILFGLHVNPQDGLLLAIPILLFYSYLYLRHNPLNTWLGLSQCFPLLFFVDKYVVGKKLGIRIAVLILFFLSVGLGWVWYTEYRDCPRRI